MKKNIFFIILICISFLSGSAQNQNNEEKEIHSLIGIWQMCQPTRNPDNPNDFVMKRNPFFKILDAEGNFTNMFLSLERSMITGTGTYEIISEDTYIETVEKSYTNPSDNSRKNKLTYNFSSDGNLLVIRYLMVNPALGITDEATEFWVRVESGNPFTGPPVQQPRE